MDLPPGRHREDPALSDRRKTATGGMAVKLIASLGVVGAAAAIAGLGAFGSFTDSTTPVDHDVATGVLSIELDGVTTAATNPLSFGGLQPGEARSVPFDVRNAGTVDWASVTFESWATASSALDTDTVNGLQLALRSCSESWTATGPSSYSCAGEVSDFYTGPIVTRTPLAGADSLRAAEVDHVLATIALPGGAGNKMKELSSGLSFTLTAAQRGGTAR